MKLPRRGRIPPPSALRIFANLLISSRWQSVVRRNRSSAMSILSRRFRMTRVASRIALRTRRWFLKAPDKPLHLPLGPNNSVSASSSSTQYMNTELVFAVLTRCFAGKIERAGSVFVAYPPPLIRLQPNSGLATASPSSTTPSPPTVLPASWPDQGLWLSL